MSLFVITCRRSNRWVVNGVKHSRTIFRWLRLFVLLRLFELKTDAEEVFLIKMFFFMKKFVIRNRKLTFSDFYWWVKVAENSMSSVLWIHWVAVESMIKMRYQNIHYHFSMTYKQTKYFFEIRNFRHTFELFLDEFIERFKKNGWFRICTKVKRFFASFCKIRLIKSLAS